jgi:hypothetical protein
MFCCGKWCSPSVCMTHLLNQSQIGVEQQTAPKDRCSKGSRWVEWAQRTWMTLPKLKWEWKRESVCRMLSDHSKPKEKTMYQELSSELWSCKNYKSYKSEEAANSRRRAVRNITESPANGGGIGRRFGDYVSSKNANIMKGKWR